VGSDGDAGKLLANAGVDRTEKFTFGKKFEPREPAPKSGKALVTKVVIVWPRGASTIK
jgi:hypothetical protein